MRRIRIMGLCLVAVFAISAVGVSAASAALPENFTLNKTTKKSEPLLPTQKITYTNLGGEAKLEGGVVIICKEDKGKGDIEGPKKTVKLKVEYKGCEAPSITSSCQKAPTKPGVITTESLKGELTYASEESGGPLVAVNKLTPEKAGKPFAKFTCGPKKELAVEVTGVIFAQPLPVNGAESKTGESVNSEKLAEPLGCSKQAFLYENGAGACQHLSTKAGTSWNVSKDAVTYKTAVSLHA